jgi:LCP family protein required for cell wall assembly
MSPLPPTRERPVTSALPDGYPGLEPGTSGRSRSATRRWVRRIAIILMVLFAVALGAVAAVAFVAKQQIDDLVTAKTHEQKVTQRELAKPLPGKPTNILVLGSDHRTGEAKTDRRSDTLLLVRLDPQRKTISMLSFPRDTYVDIPGHGKSKINDAYSFGGPALSVKTIKQLTGLDINFAVDVDFKGFRGVVDAFGGIWADVDHRYYTPPEADYMEIDLQPGYQLLDGRDALAFARYRHEDVHGDFGRIARQQLVLAGLKKQIAESSKVNSIPRLARVLGHNTVITAGGGDSVPVGVLYDYLRLATSLSSKDVYQVEFKGGTATADNGASIVTYDESDLKASVDAFLHPSRQARDQTADQLVGKQAPSAQAAGDAAQPADTAPVATVPDPSTVSVKVLNGSGIGGAAGTMAGELRSAGYKVDPAQSNADNSNYASTKVFYNGEAARPAAEALASGIDGSSVAAADGANSFTTQLLVVVGKTATEFAGAGTADGTTGTDGGPTGGKVSEDNAVPEKAAAKVTTDIQYGKDAMAGVAVKTLQVEYPSVREASSTFDDGVRSYQIVKGQSVYDAYRLVGKTAQGDYWGLQGTSWINPPILEGATREAVRGTRTYQLFFLGTKLHMIAWREGNGTYWISNSVLNTLSNETMLAIAQGVKPLR